MVIDAMLNRDISELVDASNFDLHSDLNIIWDVLGEAKDACINDIVNQLFIIQITTIANHWSKEASHWINLKFVWNVLTILHGKRVQN